MYFVAIITGTLLLAETVASFQIYASMRQALAQADAIILFVVVPAFVLVLCTTLFALALRSKPSKMSKEPTFVSSAWPIGAVIGLLGQLFATVVGPHLAGFVVYSYAAQAIVCVWAHVSRIRRKRLLGSHAK